MENSRSKQMLDKLIKLVVKNKMRKIRLTEEGRTDTDRLGLIILKVKLKQEKIPKKKKSYNEEEIISLEDLIEKLNNEEVQERDITENLLLELCDDFG